MRNIRVSKVFLCCAVLLGLGLFLGFLVLRYFEAGCEIDVMCHEGDWWRPLPNRAVGLITFAKPHDPEHPYGLCTGTLLNNNDSPKSYYFLTAWHCLKSTDGTATHVSDAKITWNYQSKICNGIRDIPEPETAQISFVAGWGCNIQDTYCGKSDFLLLKLTGNVSGTHLRFAGWDATGNTPPAGTPAVVSIHQPNDVKAISLSNSVPHDAYNYWHVFRWDKGTTEDGSSGSCLFDYNHRCIGQLEGGDEICWGWGGQSWYGKLSASWNGGGTNDTCLAHWLGLDPQHPKPDCSSNPLPGTSMDGY